MPGPPDEFDRLAGVPPPDEFDQLAAEPDEFDRLAGAEPPSLQLDQRNSDALPKQMDVALKAREAAPIDWLTKTAQEIQRRDAGRGSPDAMRLLQKLDSKSQIFKQAYKAPEIVKAAAQYSSVPGVRDEVMSRFEKQRSENEKRAGQMLGRGASTMLEKGMSGIDATRRVGTNAGIAATSTTSDFRPIDAAMNDLPQSETSALALKKSLEKSDKSGDLVGTGLNTIADAVSSVAGAVGTGLAGGMGRVWRRLDPNPNLAPHDEVMRQTFDESRDTTKEAALTLLPDLLTYVGFGGGAKGAKGIARNQGLRIMKGATPGAAETFANALADVAQTKGGTAELAPAIESLARQFGISTEKMSRVVGPDARYLGKGGMTVGLPLLSEKLTAELPKIPGLPEQLGARAIDALVEKTGLGRAVNRGVYGTDLGGLDPNAATGVKEASREARALTLTDIAEQMKKAETDIASLPGAPLTKRREEITKYFIDPDDRTGSKRLFAADLTPGELQWADAVQKYFDDFRKVQVAAGTLDPNQIGKNKLTGRYIPRQFEKSGLAAGFENRPKTLSSAQASRGPDGGHPLGRDVFLPGEKPNNARTADPYEILPLFQQKQSRKVRKALFDRQMADDFGKPYNDPSIAHLLTGEDLPMKNSRGEDVFVPRDIALTLRQNYEQAFRAFQPESTLNKWILKRFKKGMTINSMGYMVKNVPSDMALMYTGGFRDPLRIHQATPVLKTLDPNKVAVYAPGKNYTVQEIRDYAKKFGMTGSNIAADVDPLGGLDKMAQKLTEATEKVARARGDKDAPRGFDRAFKWFQRNKGDLADDALSLGWSRIGPMLAREWDETAKVAFFMDRLAKGDAPNIASQRTFEVLPDFGDRTKLQDSLSNTIAFPGWISRMATEVPKQVAKNPSVIPLTKAVAKNVGEDNEDLPPQWARERGINVQADRYQTMAYNKGLEAFGQPPIDPVNRIGMSLKTPFTDVAAPYASLASGDPQPFVAMTHPVLQAGAEIAFGVDPMNRRPFAKHPISPGGMFPQGTPGIPPGLETRTSPYDQEQEIPWLSRYLPSALGVTPQAMALGNHLLGGPILGKHRTEAPQEGQRTAASLLNMLTGQPVYYTDPVSGEQMTQDPNVQAAQDYESNLKKALEQQALKPPPKR